MPATKTDDLLKFTKPLTPKNVGKAAAKPTEAKKRKKKENDASSDEEEKKQEK